MFYLQLPLTSITWIEEYMKLGLKNNINFFGGYAEDKYYEKYGTLAKMNSRHNHASFKSLEEIHKAIEIIQSKGYKFSYVINSTNILSDTSGVKHHIDLIHNHIHPKSVIITDLAFFKDIHASIDINISSFVGINNIYTMKYFLEKFPNIKRVIFQRDIILSDIIEFQEKLPFLEYEIFIKNMWCYHNGHCTSHHKKKTQFLCLREKSIKNPKGIITSEKLKILQNSKLDCKACSLYQLKDTFLYNKDNSLYLKIPGREFSIEKVTKDAKFIDEAIENCKISKNGKEFVAKNIRNHRLIFGSYCDYKNCEYYLHYSSNLGKNGL